MLVKILVADTYNDAENRPILCTEGRVLNVTVGYGQNLIAGGLAEPYAVKMESEPEVADGGLAKKLKPAQVTKTAKGKKRGSNG